MFKLRMAEESDVVALAQFSEQTFRQTFAADNSEEDMEAYVSASFNMDRQIEEIRDDRRVITLAESGRQIIGYTQLFRGPVESAILGRRPIELARLYVDFAWHGRGVAADLLKNCFVQSLELDCQTLWLGVWERNFRAQKFYSKHGFVTVGSHVFQLGSDAQVDLLMARAIG